MQTTEIILLVIGSLFFLVSFFLPEKGHKKEERITEAEIKALIDKEMEQAKVRIDDIVDETVNYSIEKTERALERLSNEKIMAVDEYSETVLKKINDNHQEAVFLYDMLNEKDEKLKTTTEEIKSGIESLNMREQAAKETEARLLEEKERLKKAEEEKRAAEERRLAELEKAREEALVQEAVKRKQAENARIAFEKEQAKKEALERENSEKKASEKDASEKAGDIPDEIFEPLSLEKLKIEDGQAVTVSKPKSKSSRNNKKEADNKLVIVGNDSEDDIDLHLNKDYDGRKNSNEIIRRMHEEGKSNMTIARELGLGVGEVKLVIDLFSNKSK